METRTGATGIALSVIIPVLNEEDILEANLTRLAEACDTIVGPSRWQFAIVDNGSTDRTREILDRLLLAYPPSRVVFLAQPNYGAALRAGLKAVDTEFVHICDIEQWDIPFLAWAWKNRNDHELFIGSKRSDPTISRQSPRRRFLSWGLNALLQLLFGYMGTETHGPKLIDMKRLRPIIEACKSERGQFDTEIVLRSVRDGVSIAEAPVAFIEHRPPRASLVKKIGWNLVAFYRLWKQIRHIDYAAGIEFRQFSRSDVVGAIAPAVGSGRAGPDAAADKELALPG